MALGKPSATEEAGSVPVSPGTAATADIKETPRSFLVVARRNLTDEELATPAARRFLIAEIERLDQLCTEYQGIVTEYHEQRITIARLQESARPSRWVEILSSVCLAIGAAGVGCGAKLSID
jgi:hypothetical protein